MEDPSSENQRAAASIASSLSKLLISAGLTMLTILGAFVVIVLKDKEFSWLLIALSVLTLLAFLRMVYTGGQAISNLYHRVYRGEWSPEASKSDFNKQAIAALLAVLFFILTIAMTFFLDNRESSELANASGPTPVTVNTVSDSTAKLIHRLQARVDSLEETCCCTSSE
jgi:signal transduction histidine kinase